MLTRYYIGLIRVTALVAFVFFVCWVNLNWEHSPQHPSVLQKRPPQQTATTSAGLRIAIVTFTTSEKSYTYLSLKNKHGAYASARLRIPPRPLSAIPANYFAAWFQRTPGS